MSFTPPSQTSIAIVGGGAAGWLTAAILAASHNVDAGVLSAKPRLHISLIESPDVATIGVGEGTWPSMRHTLKLIGISEIEFLTCCEASFKQGSQFIDWLQAGSQYLHPFTLPTGWPDTNLAAGWLPHSDDMAFAEAVCPQVPLSLQGLAPKQADSGDYQGILNYGYHLNAGKFIELLKRHCLERLGVSYLPAHLVDVSLASAEQIATVQLQTSDGNQQALSADLYIDCTGSQSLLLGQALQTQFISASGYLLNDAALAVQLPYATVDAQIASNTKATAQPSGWIWDIGLPSRRGIGQVYAKDWLSEDLAATQLMAYIEKTQPEANLSQLNFKSLRFSPGYRSLCWRGNCVAVGMAAGFIEPLEASALALVEWTAKQLAANLPLSAELYPLAAAKLNQTYLRHWQQIIEFLKLHYCLSKRTEPYWLAQRDSATMPDTLGDKIALWQQQIPTLLDFSYQDLLFPAASYQYVMYGMGFRTLTLPAKPTLVQQSRMYFQQNYQQVRQLSAHLPNNRQLLTQFHALA